jgi:hypothetical protein
MAQHSWIYKNKVGIDYELSIYHGDKSGHVLIYSNQAIICIDFAVKNDKIFSFMLGEELFELSFMLEKGLPLYKLINKDTNKTISKLETSSYPKRHIHIAVLLVLAICIIIFIILYFINK